MLAAVVQKAGGKLEANEDKAGLLTCAYSKRKDRCNEHQVRKKCTRLNRNNR